MEHAWTEPLEKNAAKHEGRTTDLIERRTGQVPSGTYLTLAIGSMIASAALMLSARRSTFGRVSGRAELANFVGQWAPSLLIVGVYNKLVKIEHELLRKV
jgi:hypothetical protein